MQMEGVVSLKKRVESLKDEGLSYRQIAERLEISLGKVQRILSVSIQPQSVSESVSKCIDTPDTVGQTESVADLKVKFNTILTDIYSRLDKLEKLPNTLQENIDSRLYYYMKNRVEGLIENEIKKLRQELKHHN